ncbi:MAG: formiminotransferase-cyclodeaminase, partial [Bdellovibrionales bacterium GWC1_52_8]
ELREKGRVARAGRIHPYYFKGTKLAYAPGAFPCGSCSFVGKTYPEISDHCTQSHSYDLGALLQANEIDPAQLSGKNVFRPGKFKECKAIGWYVDEFKRAQISINLTNYKITPAHAVLEEARKLAAERGLVVTGSEIVGLVPYPALLESGKFYLQKQGRALGIPVEDILRTAVFSMGLADIAPFDMQKKLIGLPVDAQNALVQMPVRALADEVSRDTPAPGGGSIAALAGALGASLASMVANLTHGKEGTEEKDPALNRIAERAQVLKDQLLSGVDDDTNAFNAFMEARRLPQGTPEEKARRLLQMQQGMKIAIDVPWRTAQASFEAMLLAKEVSALGNPNSITDAAVGMQMAFAGIRGALWNVSINLKDIRDPAYVSEMQSRVEVLLRKAEATLSEGGSFIDARILEMISKSKKA